MSVEERAETCKDSGNVQFRKSKFLQALQHYDEAVALDPTKSVYYLNRATTQFHLERYEAAVDDSTRAIELQRRYVKAFYRRGMAHKALQRYRKAVLDFQVAARLAKQASTKRQATAEAAGCHKLLMEQQFLSAISGAGPRQKRHPIDAVALDTLQAPKGYTGPRLPLDGPLATWPKFDSLDQDAQLALLPESMLQHYQSQTWALTFRAGSLTPGANPDAAVACAGLASLADVSAAHPDRDRFPDMLLSGLTPAFLRGMTECFRKQELLPEKYIYAIVVHARGVLAREPNIVHVDVVEKPVAPWTPREHARARVVPKGSTPSVPLGARAIQVSRLTVLGDLHGQYFDMLEIFKRFGWPGPGNAYLFNGDWVDRAAWGLEVLVTLLALKCLYPNHIFLNRGNHECDHLTQMMGFAAECRSKYNDQMYQVLTGVFRYLPLATIISGSVFVAHGGLFASKHAEDVVSIDQLQRIPRVVEPDTDSLLSDLLWSDPREIPGRARSPRGCGVLFGPDITREFLDANGLKLLVRSHEVKEEGSEYMHNGRLLTIFSAPNYCRQGNRGAVAIFTPETFAAATLPDSVPAPTIEEYGAVTNPAPPPGRYRGVAGFM